MLESLYQVNENSKVYQNRYKMLAQTFIKKYISVAELDLCTGNTFIIKSVSNLELEGLYFPWQKVIELYAYDHTYQEDRNVVLSFSLEYMRNSLKENFSSFPVEIRCLNTSDEYNWIQVNVSIVSLEEKRILVTTQNIDKDRIMKKIVDLFVYENFDYIMLVDTKHNKYTRLSYEKEFSPVPMESGNDYTSDMIKYNKRYIVPEDVEMVTTNMQIPHIIKMLENADSYSFSSGGITDNGTYRRTRVQFRYYDKQAGLVIVSRTDVTQIYLEEQVKNAQLSAAMKAAQLDTLTGIYNHKAMLHLISKSLENQYYNLAAFLFIDVDNFKMVNDTLGHQEGDKLLCFLAKFIKKISGKDGIAGRIGGDEFLLYLPNVSDIDNISKYARQVCDIFSTCSSIFSKDLPVSCSVGISLYPSDGTDYKTLVRKADQALYTSKRYGKNKYVFYSQSAAEFIDK